MTIAGEISLDLLPLNLKPDACSHVGFNVGNANVSYSEGCGVMLLKPLHNAIADKDFIYAVLEATSSNQHDTSCCITTTPLVIPQADLFFHTRNLVQILPDHIAYFETYGTETPVGDPVVVASIANTFKNLGTQKFPLQSIGINTGQLADSRGGIFAVIKAILCLMKKQIPPIRSVLKPGFSDDMKEAPFYVNASVVEWRTSPRFASCSALGTQGTSVHVVLKEYVCSQTIESIDDDVHPINQHHSSQLLVLAANSPQSLLKFISALVKFFNSSENRTYRHLQNVCYSLNSGRMHDNLCYRAVVYANSWDRMQHNLQFLLDNEPNIDLSQKSAVLENKWGNYEGCGIFHTPTSMSLNASSFARGFYDAVLLYIKGKSISWSCLYGDNNGFKKVPFLPTYRFNNTRVWPETSHPLCLNLPQQQLQKSCEKSEHVPAIRPPTVYFSLLAETLNSILGENYDWHINGEESLLSLGINHHKLAQICRELQGTSCDLVQLPINSTCTFNTILAYFENTTQSFAKRPCYASQQEEALAVDSSISQSFVLNTNSASKNLSTTQQRILLAQGACPQSTAYVNTVAYYTQDSSTIADVFEYLVQRHPILACIIKRNSCIQNYEMGIDQQVVNFDVKIESIECLEEASLYLSKSIPVIKILASPLAVFRLLKVCNNNVTIVVVHVHHIISDDITLSNISSDIHSFLNGMKLTNNVPNVYVPISEEAYYNSSQYSTDSQFWSEKFLLLPPDVNLTMLPKADSVWNDSMVYLAKQISKSVPDKVLSIIAKCCCDLHITQFDYYLACTLLVVERYLGVSEIAIAIPVHTRSHVGKDVDGPFVNTVLFTTSVNINSLLHEYIQDIAKQWSLSVNHSQYPFDRVAKMIQKKHAKSYNSFCCVTFNNCLRNMPSNNEILVHSKHAKMPFGINIVSNQDNIITITCEWAAGIIDGGISERLFDGIFEMCKNAPSMLNQKIDAIQVLSSIELDLVHSFSHTESSFNSNGLSVIHTFEENVEKYPNACAVACQNRTLTYECLNTLATRIASGLILHVGRIALQHNPILLLSEKDEFAVVSILGVWKAGGHFLPVSSATFNSVVKSTSVSAVIINLSTDINDLHLSKVKVFSVTDLLHTGSNAVGSNVVSEEKATEDHLAYIIRTSGTTGKAKQCKITHKNLNILANAWKLKYDMSTYSVNVLQWVPLTFDVFIGDLVKALICSSGVLTICPNHFRLDIPYIISLIKQRKVTLAEVTPQFGSQLVQNAKRGDLDSLKLFILGSDVLHSHVYMKVKTHLNKNQRILNSYGMTEATIDSSYFEGSVLPRTRSNTVPVGKPLPGVHLYVVDKHTLQPCPVGTIGELYIGGSVLASGDVKKCYIKGIDHECLKTGDAACWLPSGDLELLGRLDNVVKLRGFRMSTTEIEGKIIALVKGIKDVCVAILESDEPDNTVKFLCAFVVPESNVSVDYSTIKSVLYGNIPDYMLPDIVHPIEKLPMSENGKVNHKALPKLADIWSGKILSETNLREQTQAHIILTQLLAEAMEIQSNQVHLEQSFMEQGCNSLILLRFASLIKERSSYDIDIATIFCCPSIDSLAAYINETEDHNEVSKRTVDTNKIAITGLGLKLPGGIVSLAQFWKALNDSGKDVLGSFSEKRIHDTFDQSTPPTCNMFTETKGAFLEHIDNFDPNFFQMTLDEAKNMSPEQRLFLQVATEALAEGKNLSRSRGAKIGTFVSYSYYQLNRQMHKIEAVPGIITTSFADQWNLNGPTSSTCSSSLMALKQACESIKNNDCESALVGGINLVHPGIVRTSTKSHTTACDEGTGGAMLGEGVLCIYIEPLCNALKENKYIYGIVKSIATSNIKHDDGCNTLSSVQITIKEALSDGNINPSDVGFVECHDTGTIVESGFELSALKSLFKHNHLPIGCVKAIFGNLQSTAGLLGLFKILVMFAHKRIPPTVQLESPYLKVSCSLPYSTSKVVAWKTNENMTRIAGLSSFDSADTYYHAILAEHSCCKIKNEVAGLPKLAHCPLLFSFTTLGQIKQQASLYYTYIEQIICQDHSQYNMLDLCVTVAKRLRDIKLAEVGYHECRMIILAKDPNQTMDILQVIISVTSINSLIKLSNIYNDVKIYSSKCNTATCSTFTDYLLNGNVDIPCLFPDIQNYHVTPVPCVTLVMFDEQQVLCGPYGHP